MRLRVVLGPDRSGQAILRLVCPFDDLVQVLELQDGHHRPDDFLLRDLHVVLHVGENSWLDEITLVAHAVPAGSQRRLLPLSGIDVAHHFVELVLIHLWPLFRLLVERAAYSPLLRPRHATLHELVISFFLYVNTRPSAAPLSLVV